MTPGSVGIKMVRIGSQINGVVLSLIPMLLNFPSLSKFWLLPILNYGFSVLANLECDVVQNKAIRYFMGVHGLTPVAATNGDMGWLPCKYRGYFCMFRLWNKLIKMEPNRLPKLVFFLTAQN